jgi:RTX calcium-binding nonapeptide repeat (4 copies)
MITDRKNNVNCINTNSIIYKLLLLYNNNFNLSKDFIFYFFLFCIFAYFFIVFVEIDTNIIDNAWSYKFNGTEQADIITGTLIRDTIRGFYGNDVLMGNGGLDDISGGSGDDIIYGNEDRDILKGKAGNDIIQGGEGNDRIYGDRGNDILVGAEGNDILTGGYGRDIFICETGLDTITDFNTTQKDTTPYNDCENIKSISGIEDKNNNKEMVDNMDTINDEQKQIMVSFLV